MIESWRKQTKPYDIVFVANFDDVLSISREYPPDSGEDEDAVKWNLFVFAHNAFVEDCCDLNIALKDGVMVPPGAICSVSEI